MTLREIIKKLCSDKGISVNKLEQELGFAKGYISKLDKSKPNAAKLQQIADYFNVSLDYLMTGKEPSSKFDYDSDYADFLVEIAKSEDLETLKRLVLYYSGLDKKSKEAFEKILEALYNECHKE